MRIAHTLTKFWHAGAMMLALLLPGAIAAHAQTAGADGSKLADTPQGLGAFGIGDTKFSVVAHDKTIPHANSADSPETLAVLEIRDGSGTTVYSANFPFDVQDGHFVRPIIAAASLIGGGPNAAIVIRYIEQSTSSLREDESFQVFGLVNGKLAAFGAPQALGRTDGGTPSSDALTGVMVGGGVDVEPLMSTAEVLQFRAWTGNFLVTVPVRVDWAHGKWSEGEECYALGNGTSPQRRGCNLGLATNPRPPVDGASVTLYSGPVEDHYASQSISLEGKSSVVFVGVQALVNWKTNGDRFACTLDNVWLHVRIDGHDGWVHSESDLAALGLPVGNPPQ